MSVKYIIAIDFCSVRVKKVKYGLVSNYSSDLPYQVLDYFYFTIELKKKKKKKKRLFKKKNKQEGNTLLTVCYNRNYFINIYLLLIGIVVIKYIP